MGITLARKWDTHQAWRADKKNEYATTICCSSFRGLAGCSHNVGWCYECLTQDLELLHTDYQDECQNTSSFFSPEGSANILYYVDVLSCDLNQSYGSLMHINTFTPSNPCNKSIWVFYCMSTVWVRELMQHMDSFLKPCAPSYMLPSGHWEYVCACLIHWDDTMYGWTYIQGVHGLMHLQY